MASLAIRAARSFVLMDCRIKLGAGSVSRPEVPNITILPNVKASGNGTDISNENPIAANPSNALQLLSGANDYNCSSLQGFYSSDNDGASWRSHCMPSVGAGGCGDPNVAYDTTGASYILGIGDCNGLTGSIVLQKSTDNGLTWGTAHKVINPLFAGGITDKEWTEVDHSATSPFKDRIYTSITQFDGSSNSAISVSYSTDGGATSPRSRLTRSRPSRRRSISSATSRWLRMGRCT
jgi:hypothetical protein